MKVTFSAVLWTARVLALAMCAFLALFAFDEWAPDKPLLDIATDVLIHLLPSALVLGAVGLSWRRPWLGGFAFVGLAVVYALTVGFRLDWVFPISGPLLAVGLLFFWGGALNNSRFSRPSPQ